MSLDQFDLYGGLCGPSLPVDEYDFGRGVTITRTFAHLMAPFMMAFAPAQPGQPHPAPWRAAKGGFGFDIIAQLHVPKDFLPQQWFDRLNTVWWFVALLRFRASPFIMAPVIANAPFQKAVKDEDIIFWPTEVEPRTLCVDQNASTEIHEEALDWIRANWWNAGKLMRASESFNLLFQACDQCIFTRSPALALLSLWGAIEGLFSLAKTELRFRVSANIAAFLEPPGAARLELQKTVAKLYDARSSAAHGSKDVPHHALTDSYSLTKRIITKIIEDNHVPIREDLEMALFGGAVAPDRRPHELEEAPAVVEGAAPETSGVSNLKEGGAVMGCCAIRYATSGIKPCAVVKWSDNKYSWKWLSSEAFEARFRKTIETTDALPKGSATRRALAGELAPATGFFETGSTAAAWFPHLSHGAFRNVTLIEQAIQLGRFGVLTFLYPEGDSFPEWRDSCATPASAFIKADTEGPGWPNTKISAKRRPAHGGPSQTGR